MAGYNEMPFFKTISNNNKEWRMDGHQSKVFMISYTYTSNIFEINQTKKTGVKAFRNIVKNDMMSATFIITDIFFFLLRSTIVSHQATNY